MTEVAKWLISHNHATIMMRKLNQRKHKSLGFYYGIEDIGNVSKYLARHPWLKEGVGFHDRVFADYGPTVEGCWLFIYRDPSPLQTDGDRAYSRLKQQVAFNDEIDLEDLKDLLLAYAAVTHK
jgi:hypothetical protein